MSAKTLPFRYFFHLALMLTGLLWASAVCAQVFTVNTEADVTDAVPGNGICAAANGQCSLRAAIMEANALPGADTVILPKGVYQISIPGQNEDSAVTGDLDILDDLSIKGEGANNSIIDGGQRDRVLDIRGNTNVNINDITIRHGKTDLTNYEQNNNGGGILIEGRSIVIIRGSAISNNSGDIGGGLYIGGDAQADVTIESSIISNNKAGAGGGVANGNAVTRNATIHFINTTLSGNAALLVGGGLFTGALVNVINSTITNNTAQASGAGFFTSGQVTLRNSILAGNYLARNYGTNTTGASNCYSTPLYSEGHNLIGNNLYCRFEAISSDLVGTPSNPIDPLLGPLTPNGGPTPTHALLPNSPALDAGNPLPVGRGGGACEPTDQRGEPRTGHGPCDIGAYEATHGGDAWLTLTVAPNTTPSRERIQYLLTVGNTGPQRIRKLSLTLTPPRGSPPTTVTGADWTCTAANNLYTCQREILNAGSESPLDVHLTPPPDTKEITLEARVETVSQDTIPANNQATLTTVLNRPPRVLATGPARYQGKPVPVAPSLTIEDDDDTFLKSASVRFLQGYRWHEDNLTAPSSTATLTSHWQPEQATLTLTGLDTVSAYEQALRAITYENTATTPTPHARLLWITVADAYADSDPAPVELEVTGTNSGDLPTGTAGGINNPFVGGSGSARGDTTKSTARGHRPLAPAARGEGGDKSKEEAGVLSRLLAFSGLNERTANSGWPSAGSIDNERPWLTMKSITEPNGSIGRTAAVVSASVAFAAGAINLYMRAGTILGLIFSFPLWGSVDPVHVLLVSSRERKRRNKEIYRERKIEDQVDRVGRYFEQ